MSVYHLYLDESETKDDLGKNRAFCIAGVIVEENDVKNILIPSIKNLKKMIWNDLSNTDAENIILHEKDIRYCNNFRNKKNLTKVQPEFHRFVQNANIRLLYSEIGKIYQCNKILVIGSCVTIDNLYSYFHKDIISDKYIICMQMLFENFCQFLKSRNSIGYVFYESREEFQDKEVRMRFNNIKSMGSLYISPYAMQIHLKDIAFPSKSENNCGLQLADFVPNGFARYYAGLNEHRFNINEVLNLHRYDGGVDKPERFGIKVLP